MANRNVRKSVRKDEKAVSPVIGVILMVAITVILAAVIGAFVFGMGGSLKKTYTVGVTATQVDSDHVDVTFQGGPDAGVVSYMNVTIGGETYGRAAAIDTTAEDNVLTLPAFGEVDDSSVPVGTAITCEDGHDAEIDSITSDRDHLVVTATFMDGTKQIVLDTYV